MNTNFVEELRWRGMLHDIMPGTEELLQKEMTSAYIGFDPTADSLGVGNLVQVMMLLHFQRAGHKPIAIIGGATGMVGDPSGKSAERNLLDAETLQHNLDCQKKQLEKFLDFTYGTNKAEIHNNYDWMKDFSFLDFIRVVGKHISINYMLAKDSVQSRLETGMSFTEFSYQLIQGYDFYYLYQNHGVRLQMGGSDQWGNITTGTELIRRMSGGEAFALTTPLIKKADGTKFGKTEGGNVWLDAAKTSPYKFYQFWLNASDDDVKNYIRIFTTLTKAEIESLEAQHAEAPHQRLLQKTLAKDITTRVHSEHDYHFALKASEILFGNSSADDLQTLSAGEFEQVFEGVPRATVNHSLFNEGIHVVELVTTHTNMLPSKGEAKRALQGNGIKINKAGGITMDTVITTAQLINNKYLLLQKGKKDYFVVVAE